MNQPPLILRQRLQESEFEYELRTIGQACMLMDVPMRTVSLAELAQHAVALRDGAMPAGSVEFVREALRVAGIPEPANISYPPALHAYLERDVRLTTAGEVTGPCFVKPAQTKLFTGFVLQASRAGQDHPEHDRPHLERFLALHPQTPVWVAQTVKFAAEWRVYVLDSNVIGMQRYDPDGQPGIEAPDPEGRWLTSLVRDAQDALDLAAFAIDVGRIPAGEDRLSPVDALVELNDAWALGLYSGAMRPRDYLTMLWARWRQISMSK